MTFREFLDSILTFIEAPTLTDEEFEPISAGMAETLEPTVEVYEALRDVLLERDSVSDAVDWLERYFVARKVDLDSSDDDEPIAASNILIGSVLE